VPKKAKNTAGAKEILKYLSVPEAQGVYSLADRLGVPLTELAHDWIMAGMAQHKPTD